MEKGEVVAMQIDDVAVDVLELEGNPGQRLATTIKVVHATDNLVEDDVARGSIDKNLLDDAAIARHGHRVEVANARRGQIEIADANQVDVTRDPLCVVPGLGHEVLGVDGPLQHVCLVVGLELRVSEDISRATGVSVRERDSDDVRL